MSAILITDARKGVPNDFLDLREKIYCRDSMEIPEDRAAITAQFSASNPWLAHNEAASMCVEGQARTAVFAPGSLLIEGKRACFFGFFESLDPPGDAEATQAVLAQAESWARKRGAESLFGPINFSTYNNYRIRLDAEPGAITFPGEPYNPGYYRELLEVCGYSLHQGYRTQIAPIAHLDQARSAREACRTAIETQGFTIQPLSHDKWLSSIDEFQLLVESTFRQNFAYTPMSRAMFSQVCGPSFIQKADPEVSVVCLGPGGEIAGFFLVYPHYGPLVTRSAGNRRLPVDALDFATHWPQLQSLGHKVAIAKTVGVHPAFRRKGIMDAMSLAALDQGEKRYERWFGALIRDDNPSRNFGDSWETAGRTYGLFSKCLTAG